MKFKILTMQYFEFLLTLGLSSVKPVLSAEELAFRLYQYLFQRFYVVKLSSNELLLRARQIRTILGFMSRSKQPTMLWALYN